MNSAKVKPTPLPTIRITLPKDLLAIIEILRKEQQKVDGEKTATAKMIRLLIRSHPQVQDLLSHMTPWYETPAPYQPRRPKVTPATAKP